MSWEPIETAPRDGTAILLLHKDGHYGIGTLQNVWFDNLDLKVNSAAWVGQTAYDNRPGVWMESNGPFNATHWHPIPKPVSP
jgi:hypothetical protein